MFSSPFNWCDRRCERCRLSPICDVAKPAKDEAAGMTLDQESSFDELLTELDESARQEAVAGEGSAVVLGERARRIIDLLESSDSASLEAFAVIHTIERLASYLGDSRCDELDPIDTIPNLLLERLIEDRPENAATALRAELAPEFDAIDPRLRGALRMLIETGLAPSRSALSMRMIRTGSSRSVRRHWSDLTSCGPALGLTSIMGMRAIGLESSRISGGWH